jgi:hypothetical protein
MTYDLEHRQVQGDDDAADYDHPRPYVRGERLNGGADLRLVEFRYLAEHPVYVPGLFADGCHAGDPRVKTGSLSSGR